MKKYINGELLDMTADEITASEAESKAWTDGQADRDMAALRIERNRLLAETDHWVLSDTSNATSQQLAYRQALRDITDSATSLNDVNWPSKP